MERCPTELINFFQGNTSHLVKFDRCDIAWKEQIFTSPNKIGGYNFAYSVQLSWLSALLLYSDAK